LSQHPVSSLTAHFSSLEDPRTDHTKLHELSDILVIAICGVICGADGWVSIEEFGNAKLDWLRTILELPNGIPSHDTFGRVFARLDPEQFQRCFLGWVQAISEVTEGEVVAVDGKTLRRSKDGTLGKDAIHMVSAWASENRLTLAQKKVNDKSNEITAIPALLELLELKGCIVTTDALGCQTEIASTVIEGGGDYVLPVKNNQKTLRQDVEGLFEYAHEIGFQDVEHDFHRTVNGGHGRIEIRRIWTISDPEFIDWLDPKDRWEDLESIGMVEGERRIDGKTEQETRYYISSLTGEAEELGHAVRSHWGIENCVHWVLDIAFREDDSRVRKGHGAENLAILRRLALNLLRQETTATCGTKNKRLKAAWDEDYLLKVLSSG
jgi:predicted transposase YbfD/YdcC